MRLIHWNRAGTGSREQAAGVAVPAEEPVVDHHVTTPTLKRQFEERLAKRARRRRAGK